MNFLQFEILSASVDNHIAQEPVQRGVLHDGFGVEEIYLQ